jgi:hypothetical protein
MNVQPNASQLSNNNNNNNNYNNQDASISTWMTIDGDEMLKEAEEEQTPAVVIRPFLSKNALRKQKMMEEQEQFLRDLKYFVRPNQAQAAAAVQLALNRAALEANARSQVQQLERPSTAPHLLLVSSSSSPSVGRPGSPVSPYTFTMPGSNHSGHHNNNNNNNNNSSSIQDNEHELSSLNNQSIYSSSSSSSSSSSHHLASGLPISSWNQKSRLVKKKKKKPSAKKVC